MTMAASDVKTNLRLPGDLYERIKQLADKEVRSANAQIIVLLREAIERRERDQAKP